MLTKHMNDEDREFWERASELDDAAAEAGGYVVPLPDDPAERAAYMEEIRKEMRVIIAQARAKETLKCICGSVAKVQYRDMPVRVDGKMVTVKNSPGYVCSECSKGMTKGSDSIQMTDRAKIAFENNWDEIEF